MDIRFLLIGNIFLVFAMIAFVTNNVFLSVVLSLIALICFIRQRIIGVQNEDDKQQD